VLGGRPVFRVKVTTDDMQCLIGPNWRENSCSDATENGGLLAMALTQSGHSLFYAMHFLVGGFCTSRFFSLSYFSHRLRW